MYVKHNSSGAFTSRQHKINFLELLKKLLIIFSGLYSRLLLAKIALSYVILGLSFP
jgi:hypothetical protein